MGLKSVHYCKHQLTRVTIIYFYGKYLAICMNLGSAWFYVSDGESDNNIEYHVIITGGILKSLDT